jgi:hypothetical protein
MRHPLDQLPIATTAEASHVGVVLPMSSAYVMSCGDGGSLYSAYIDREHQTLRPDY